MIMIEFNRGKRALLVALMVCCGGLRAFAAGGLSAGESTLLNPDPHSSALGNNILSLTNSPAVLFTNPAGMASLLQPKMSFSTLLLNEGMNDSFAGIACPTGFGTFGGGVSYTNFGEINAYDVNGIRDAVPGSADTQIMFGYALSVKRDIPLTEELYAVGVALRMFNSNLAGYSASGMAVDLGGIYHIPQVYGLSAGVVYRNAGTSLTYEKKAYGFPSSLSAGLRYEKKEWGNLALVADVTAGKKGTPFSYSGGVSASPVYPLTVQMGWVGEQDALSSGLRGGIGLDFNDVSLHYAVMPSKDLSLVQSMGVDIAFGKIVRPKSAYDYYLRYHYEQAQQNFKKSDFILARQQLEEILSIYPDHLPSKELLEKIGEAIDSEEQQKSAEKDRWLRKGNVALSKDNPIAARRYYGYVLGIDPECNAANEGMKKADVLIEKNRRAQMIEENREKLIHLWDAAIDYYKKGEYVDAKEKFNELIIIDPDNIKAVQFLSEIDGKLQKISTLQLNEIYVQGKRFYEAGNYREAMRYFSAVVTADPSRTDAKEYHNLCQSAISAESERTVSPKTAQKKSRTQEELEAAFNRAVTYYENGDYDESLKAFAKCRDAAQRNGLEKLAENARHYITTIRGLLAEHNYKVGYDYCQKNKLEQAASKYRKALEYNPEFGEARSELVRISDVLAQQIYEQGMKEFANGNSEKAKELFKKSLSYKPNKAESLRALERIQ